MVVFHNSPHVSGFVFLMYITCGWDRHNHTSICSYFHVICDSSICTCIHVCICAHNWLFFGFFWLLFCSLGYNRHSCGAEQVQIEHTLLFSTTHSYPCAHTHIHVHAVTHAHLHVFTCICSYIRIHALIHVCMHMFSHMHILHVHMLSHIHTHICTHCICSQTCSHTCPHTCTHTSFLRFRNTEALWASSHLRRKP